jgi:hypothetical protein
MKMDMPAQHCMEHWVIMALGYTRKERGELGLSPASPGDLAY